MSAMDSKRLRASLIERAAAFTDYGLPPLEPFGPDETPVWPRPEPEARKAAEPAQQAATPPALDPEPLPLRSAAPALDRVAPVVSPKVIGPVARIDRALLEKGGMLVPGAAIGALAEEFRLVKRQLLLTARGIAAKDADKARAILVCSARPNEGKTYCALNLALSMAAERDTEVLLVDADFAKPDVMARLGLEEGLGLLDALADPTIDAESLIVRTDVPQLSILPAGAKATNDTELLASARTATVLSALLAADPRRLLIFDSPPALAASPASVLASHAGQIMLVVRADRTSETDLKQSVALLDGCEHIQLILNAVAHTPGGRRFGSYYGQETEK